MTIRQRTIPAEKIFDALSRRVIEGALANLREGCVRLVDGEREIDFGDPGAALNATVFVHHPRFYGRVARGGDLGAAESLMDGDWTCDDLTSLVRILIRNSSVTNELGRGLGRLKTWLAQIVQSLRRNTLRGSRRNISRHYDLGNDFFELFLDETLAYSCGMFDSGVSNMRQASLAKFERVCRALELCPEDHLLEIGGGWGGLAIYAAQNFGCRVTTTTISEQQRRAIAERVAAAGLEDRVAVLTSDYRQLTGCYDKLVSIEMIEAVGHQYYDAFFRRCGSLLANDGLMLLQGIVIADHCYETHKRSVDFIGQYIFPGGSLPSVSALLSSMARATDMRCVYLEDFAPHYAETLRHWRRSFLQALPEVRQQGFDERFIRMWDYYLCYCEGAFEERRVNVAQLLFAKPQARRVMTNWRHERTSAIDESTPSACRGRAASAV